MTTSSNIVLLCETRTCGTRSAYNRGCRGDACKGANAAHSRAQVQAERRRAAAAISAPLVPRPGAQPSRKAPQPPQPPRRPAAQQPAQWQEAPRQPPQRQPAQQPARQEPRVRVIPRRRDLQPARRTPRVIPGKVVKPQRGPGRALGSGQPWRTGETGRFCEWCRDEPGRNADGTRKPRTPAICRVEVNCFQADLCRRHAAEAGRRARADGAVVLLADRYQEARRGRGQPGGILGQRPAWR